MPKITYTKYWHPHSVDEPDFRSEGNEKEKWASVVGVCPKPDNVQLIVGRVIFSHTYGS